MIRPSNMVWLFVFVTFLRFGLECDASPPTRLPKLHLHTFRECLVNVTSLFIPKGHCLNNNGSISCVIDGSNIPSQDYDLAECKDVQIGEIDRVCTLMLLDHATKLSRGHCINGMCHVEGRKLYSEECS
uniref:Secreted protein n=1 Tax=Rhabditophanes sp. KR3021 TaxID=114890 RepID=A0AC35U6U6_9BILA